MAYHITSITMRTNNSDEGMEQIEEVWQDITNGRLPLLFDSQGRFRQGVSPVARYSGYQSDEAGGYDLSIIAVTSQFFAEMEQAVGVGRYKKYEATGDDLVTCAKMAWGKVWAEQNSGVIQREFSQDYESTVPKEYTKDGRAHCYLYIAVK